MFSETAFNGNVSFWDTSSVTDMQYMFYYARSFGQTNLCWNTSKAFTGNMFTGTNGASFATNPSFPGCLYKRTAKPTSKPSKYPSYKPTNKPSKYPSYKPTNKPSRIPISDANIKTAVQSWLTVGTSCPYGDIASWDVSQVTNMAGLFNGIGTFNGDLSKWNTSKVTNMNGKCRDHVAIC